MSEISTDSRSPRSDKTPSLAELLANSMVLSLPMKYRFRGIQQRELMLLQGSGAWAEFSPFPEYSDQEAIPWLQATIEAGWGHWPSPQRQNIPINATVPAVPAAQVAEILDHFGEVAAVKVKVAEPGQSLSDDCQRLAAVRRHLPEVGLRVDANAAWNVTEATAALARMSEYRLEYAEQPVSGIENLARLREQLATANIPVKIAADEGLRKSAALGDAARQLAEAADLLVIKAAPLGGVQAALELVNVAGLPAVVSSALESSVGLQAGIALAAALPELPYACGLGTASFFRTDVSAEPLQAVAGKVPVREVEIRPEQLSHLAVSPERASWWRQRLARVYTLAV